MIISKIPSLKFLFLENHKAIVAATRYNGVYVVVGGLKQNNTYF